MKNFVWRKILTNVLLILLFVVSCNLLCFANTEYPTQPVTIIIPFGTGGSYDTAARTMQRFLQDALGAPAVIVENLPGGGTIMGITEFNKRKADGYTILMADTGGMVLTKLKNPNALYEIKDFAPVIGLSNDPRTFFVQKGSSYNDVGDLIEDIRKNPDKISLGLCFGGSVEWLAKWLKKRLDLPVNLVGFAGGGPATIALIGGHIDAYFDAGAGRVPYKDKIKAIGVAYPERTKNWPDATPLLELDAFKGIDYVPGEEAASYCSFFVRREVKEDYPERFYKLVSAFYEVSKNPEFNKAAAEIGLAPNLVWEPPSKVDEKIESMFKLMSADKELLK